MTVKTYDQLIASFPDNSSGLINPIDIRNLVDSLELKYDNWTVVKPGQPNGNRFPAPSGGVITLPDNTVWIINGQVTINYPLLLGNNVTIAGISGSYLNDQILLDPAAGAVAILNNTADEVITIRTIGLVAMGGTGRIVDITDPTSIVFSECVFAADDMGSITFAGAQGDAYFVDRCVNLVTDQPLQLAGSGGNLIFDAVRSGFSNTDIQFDVQGTFESISIRNCYNASTFAMFQLSEGSASVGIISNNQAAPTKPFIDGIDETSVNFTFEGNSGMQNTIVGGCLAMSRNTVSTINPGIGLWAAVVGNGLDTLCPNPCRIERNSALEVEYTGNDPFDGRLTLELAIKRASGTAVTPFSVGVFKNGKLITVPRTVSLASITRVGTLATATLSAAFPLVNGMEVTVAGANQAQYNGTFVISGVAGLTFQYTMSSDPGASATGTLTAVVPIERTLPVGLTDVSHAVTLHIVQEFEPGDLFKPYIRPEASGTIDAVVESLAIFID